jgi:hypothetical protein
MGNYTIKTYSGKEEKNYEVKKKGELSLIKPLFLKIIEKWKERYPNINPITEENFNYFSIGIKTNEPNIGNLFISFVEEELSSNDENKLDYPYIFLNSSRVGMCSIYSSTLDEIVIKFEDPNQILKNLTLAFSLVISDPKIYYDIKKYPIFLKIRKGLDMIASESSFEISSSGDVLMEYNHQILSKKIAIERGVQYVFDLFNLNLLKVEFNLNREKYPDEIEGRIKKVIKEIIKKTFFSFDPQKIERDPLEICVILLKALPYTISLFDKLLLQKILDRYPGSLPNQEIDIRTSPFEKTTHRKDIQDLELNSPLEGEI